MTVTTEAPFYDKAMTNSHEPAMLPLETSPWLSLYQRASWWIPTTCPVVDLGCGTGRFAEQLRRRDHERYFGLDFSPAVIDVCRDYVPAQSGQWRATFDVVDLREWEPSDRRASHTIYVCLETLEHLEDDLDLVRRIPTGHEFIFSVPNFGGQAHLRVFRDPAMAYARFGGLLSFRAWEMIGEGPHNFIHLYRTIRRADSW